MKLMKTLMLEVMAVNFTSNTQKLVEITIQATSVRTIVALVARFKKNALKLSQELVMLQEIIAIGILTFKALVETTIQIYSRLRIAALASNNLELNQI